MADNDPAAPVSPVAPDNNAALAAAMQQNILALQAIQA